LWYLTLGCLAKQGACWHRMRVTVGRISMFPGEIRGCIRGFAATVGQAEEPLHCSWKGAREGLSRGAGADE
jgi:hypothetical protein